MSKAKVSYEPAADRYERAGAKWFRRCGKSGLMLPAISLGLWHNFGTEADDDNTMRLCFTAFDRGITHFDIANNYGPPPGSAEKRFGKIVKELPRDELIVASKAGFTMWPGPYGDWGSRKYLLASLDQSLKRMKLDYVDIFYHHRPDPQTPIEETLGALDTAVKQGKAIYAAISNYSGEQTDKAVRKGKAKKMDPLLIHQVNYSLYRRPPENDLFPVTKAAGMGVICFCPLAQGLLTDKYLTGGIPDNSRAANPRSFLKPERITPEIIDKSRRLNDIAKARGQSLAQMALAWVLRRSEVTSALIGASRPSQIEENVAAAENIKFADDELALIDKIVA